MYENNPNKYINFGLRKSPDDSRDYQYSSVCKIDTTRLPSSFLLKCTPVRDQGNLGACVGFGSSAITECDFMTNAVNDILSPLDLYSECKAIDNSDGEGTYLRTALTVLKNRGVCKENLYKYIDDANVKANIFPTKSASIKTDAALHKIAAYAALNTIIDIKKAVYVENGALLGVCVTDSFMHPQGGCVGGMYGSIYGGHCVGVVGWDDNIKLSYDYSKIKLIQNTDFKEYTGALIIKNSWTKNWGVNGYGYIPYAVFDLGIKEDFKINLFSEAWTTIHSKSPTYDENFHVDINTGYNTIKLTLGSNIITTNGISSVMDVVPEVKNGRTLVPIRAISEAIGYNVFWDDRTSEITITNKPIK